MRLTAIELNKVGPFKKQRFEFKKNKKKGLAEVHIFTGPNGSGKSTVLRSLAYIFADAPYPKEIASQFWTSGRNGSFVGVFNSISKYPATFASSGRVGPDGRANPPGELIVKSMKDGNDPFHIYTESAREYRYSDKESLMSYAVFAYSGGRKMNSGWGSPYQIVEFNPFETALDFDRGEKGEISISEWIAPLKFKEALSRGTDDTELKAAASTTLSDLESLVSDIIQRKFRLHVNHDVLEVEALIDGQEIPLNTLPDGIKSIMSWVGNLVMRMDRIRWKNKVSLFDQPIILFLDEIDIHLHPKWQKRILPIVQKTFKNAQIFVTTHSPFVVASVEDAWVYDLAIDEKTGEAGLDQKPIREGRENPYLTEKGYSYARVLREVFDVESQFVDPDTEKALSELKEYVKKAKLTQNDLDAALKIEDDLEKVLKNVNSRELVAAKDLYMNQIRNRFERSHASSGKR